ncbi:cofactor-independent phosphoglycerate mutase [Clostridium thermosuccinogenes]|jgi:2,3-bisphosphoglycerate-independent phosphoglycerate mutase|uniref:Cofactor-independent phosphoglycerate mutase n=1 Tax=Clostridium thermosuccinogenes TaxID=84032 RepID=A0A2K2F1Q9_9CLOT|nr:cofactor-independent phosphoglycerate mutase [Pseudoclostridium thermosuccinogenes]AUS96613.1 cofactor-independent phosphoglycerate mutase [Pseudoclostridium thermosuccinogenes]PNT91917.1 cofactor-independent phosphoglycerate mutase [Pseudoclostridium thermosuccinogenes]PNT92727.1 cofactor-independent phosphoglycerate mutase [Pseudoclostridium thermosuccinogenes]PNT94744.1 cofactor-independent phosphoglycerate mutase [Pseudoclostridium thermosuccinogenes]
MKYIVIIGDGMADYPVPQLGNKTPLQKANKPNMDFLAKHGEIGMVRTIPEGISPGSDTANLSVMGYDPRKYYTGRSPLEAVSMGIELSDTDVALRCNLVTLSEEENYEDRTMIDYSSDEITSEEARELIDDINRHLKTDSMTFFPGVSYRHCLVWKNGPVGLNLTPPHDILTKKIAAYLPSGEENKVLLDMMKKSSEFMKEHPVNKSRVARGLKPANSIWLWGEGRKPAIPLFYDKYRLRGSVISAVDLIKGIGLCAGLKSVDIPGATGNINTNFKGKAEAALKELENGQDFVYVHIEAPDECGHRYEIENKVRSIELIDELVIGTILKGLDKFDEYSILVLPDHPTPLSLRTHTSDPVPYILYRKGEEKTSDVLGYDESEASGSGFFIEEGYTLMDRFIG